MTQCDRAAARRYRSGMAGRLFVKGQSGNPGGRPKAAQAMARLIATATRDGAELVELALAVVRGDNPKLKDPKSWAYAHNWLTERVAGKAPQVVTLGSGDQPIVLDDSALTDEQLAVLATLDASNPPRPALRLVPEEAEPEGTGHGEPDTAG